VEPSSAPWRVIEPVEPEAQPSAPGGTGRDLPWVAIGAALIAFVVAISAILLAARPDPAIEVDGAVSADTGSVVKGGTAAADPVPSPTLLVVEVGGAVAHPGVYRLAAGARVMDAVTAAGGFGPRVDAAAADARLNLAAPLKDGDEIHVPVRGEAQPTGGGATGPAGGGATGGSGGATGTGPIDLNHASAEALDTLPGVGPATVAKIIAAREEQPFASVDDLGARKVVGPATLEKLRPLVTVTP
jgi:competence protein ComEA